MRKISIESSIAFFNKTTYKKNNTEIIVKKYNDYDIVSEFYLYNHLIAIYDKDNKLFISNAGFETNTTKERLNCMLSLKNFPGIYQKNGIWYIKQLPFPYDTMIDVEEFVSFI